MTRQTFLRQDAFGKNPWQGPRALAFRSLGQGCSIPKGESAPSGGGGMVTPAAGPAEKPWIVPAIAAGGVAAVGAALWALGVL